MRVTLPRLNHFKFMNYFDCTLFPSHLHSLACCTFSLPPTCRCFAHLKLATKFEIILLTTFGFRLSRGLSLSFSLYLSLSLLLTVCTCLEKRLLFYKPSLSSICVRDGDNDGDVISISVIGSLTLCSRRVSRRGYSILTWSGCLFDLGFMAVFLTFVLSSLSLPLSLSFLHCLPSPSHVWPRL